MREGKTGSGNSERGWGGGPVKVHSDQKTHTQKAGRVEAPTLLSQGLSTLS